MTCHGLVHVQNMAFFFQVLFLHLFTGSFRHVGSPSIVFAALRKKKSKRVGSEIPGFETAIASRFGAWKSWKSLFSEGDELWCRMRMGLNAHQKMPPDNAELRNNCETMALNSHASKEEDICFDALEKMLFWLWIIVKILSYYITWGLTSTFPRRNT